eukprot:CAMPEP_0118933698 /NCGR_PEP_ID=MMETSP1169-20130426/12191_1 /TAXON_ID=36882 /ORGANISM="Pyramimonas obovata, Strain CCMP722" /LENGTH=355 /DNA_ID=CAMNT_0006876495 /DNA_START=41 /DNA_END=1108 /DNA_ORIENTATION=-
MAAKLTATVHNHTNSKVSVLRAGSLTSSRKHVKPNAVTSVDLSSSWQTARYFQVEVATGARTRSERMRVKCDGTPYEYMRCSKFVIVIVQEKAMGGAELRIGVDVRCADARVPTTTQGRIGESGSLSRNSSKPTFSTSLEALDFRQSNSTRSTDLSSAGKHVGCMSFNFRTRRSGSGGVEQRDEWAIFRQRSLARLEKMRTSSENVRALREIALSVELSRTSTAAPSVSGERGDDRAEETSAATDGPHTSRVSHISSEPRKSRKSAPPSLTSSTSFSRPRGRAEARAPSIDFANIPFRRSRCSGRSSYEKPAKILHRDDLLEQISSGLGGSNPFVISPSEAAPTRAQVAFNTKSL